MRRCAYLVVLAIASQAAGEDYAVSLGLSDWTPRLEAVRRAALETVGRPLESDSRSQGHLSLTMRTDTGWSSISYAKWQGGIPAHPYHLRLRNWGYTRGMAGPLGLSGGIGANLLRLRRTASPSLDAAFEGARSDWLWGLHATAGVSWSVLGPVSMELRHTRLWTRRAHLNGLPYDLGGGMTTISASLDL